jgi:hypothetical protein
MLTVVLLDVSDDGARWRRFKLVWPVPRCRSRNMWFRLRRCRSHGVAQRTATAQQSSLQAQGNRVIGLEMSAIECTSGRVDLPPSLS